MIIPWKEILDDGIACDNEERTCVTMQWLGSKGTLKKQMTHYLYVEKSPAASFLFLIQWGWQDQK